MHWLSFSLSNCNLLCARHLCCHGANSGMRKWRVLELGYKFSEKYVGVWSHSWRLDPLRRTEYNQGIFWELVSFMITGSFSRRLSVRPPRISKTVIVCRCYSVCRTTALQCSAVWIQVQLYLVAIDCVHNYVKLAGENCMHYIIMKCDYC